MRSLRPLIAQTIAISIVFASSAAANSFEAAVKAPVNCSNGSSCGYDVDLSEVIDSAKKYQTYLNQCDQKYKDKDKCMIEAAVYGNICGEPRRFYYRWGRVDQILYGRRIIEELLGYAKSGEAYGVGADQQMFIQATKTPPNEQHLALCSVQVVKGAVGPPRKCTTVAIITPSSTFLRGGSDRGSCFLSASIRLDTGIIDIQYNLTTTLDVEPFANSISRMLSDNLGLTVDSDVKRSDDGRIYNESLRSAAPLRDSKILTGGWRESFAFDLEVGRDGKTIEVTGSSEPMICRQASGNLVDYQAPDDAQRGIYARALDTLVGDALIKVCHTYTKTDSKNIVCN
jgi:hypothetical protein